MQNQFVLDPAYKGPLIIEEHFRKMKAQTSFKMLSTYNKRFFVLDLKRMLFYYLPERGSALANAKDIPFVIIRRIYLDSQLGLLDDTQMWKHGFVMITGRRSFKMIAHSLGSMETLLYALGHIIDTETKQPLFDWNEYKSAQVQRANGTGIMPPRPQINSLPGTIADQKPNSGTGTSITSLASPTANNNRMNQNAATSIVDNRNMSPDKGRQDDPNDRPRVQERQTSITETGSENPQSVPQIKKEPKQERKPVESRLQEQPVVNNAPLAQKQLNVRETDKIEMCESQVVMSNESMLASAVQNEQQQVQQVREKAPVSVIKEQYNEKIEKRAQNRVEVLSIDPLESYVPMNNIAASARSRVEVLSIDPLESYAPMSNIPASAKARQSRRPFGHEFGSGLKSKPYKSNDEEHDSLGLNSTADKSQTVTKLASPKGFNPYYQRLLGQEQNVREEISANNFKQQNNQDQGNSWDIAPARKEAVNANKPKLAQVDDWDREEVTVKKENVYKVEKKVNDDDDWDRDMESPPKKNKAKEVVAVQKINKQDVDDWDIPAKKNVAKPQTNNAVKKVQDDDDWDKDMSDDDNGKSKTNSRFEVKKDSKYKDFTSSESGFGKPFKGVESSYKQNVVPAKATAVHNDWDDDL